MTVFLSHSQQDEAIYSILCMALDNAQIKHWDPLTMSTGESLADQLKSAIHLCEVCVLVGTRRSIESKWCLAELGAFWGAGKRVIIYLADPDLTDTQLPPQFKGSLRANNANRLIADIRQAAAQQSSAPQNTFRFHSTSGSYGNDTDWAKFLLETNNNFKILGFTLAGWRNMNNSEKLFLDKADEGCKIRILMMSDENPLLDGLLLGNKKSLEAVKYEIRESYRYFSLLSKHNENIETKKITKGMPHFFLTMSDFRCLLIQYTSSADWGNGPTWSCEHNNDLYQIADKEFQHLWTVGASV